jgi:hypothetical protein
VTDAQNAAGGRDGVLFLRLLTREHHDHVHALTPVRTTFRRAGVLDGCVTWKFVPLCGVCERYLRDDEYMYELPNA